MNINNKNSDEFEILRKINNLEKPNQRDLAYELGFSLGKLNYCIKALRKKGFVKIRNFKKIRIKYSIVTCLPQKASHTNQKWLIFL